MNGQNEQEPAMNILNRIMTGKEDNTSVDLFRKDMLMLMLLALDDEPTKKERVEEVVFDLFDVNTKIFHSLHKLPSQWNSNDRNALNLIIEDIQKGETGLNDRDVFLKEFMDFKPSRNEIDYCALCYLDQSSDANTAEILLEYLLKQSSGPDSQQEDSRCFSVVQGKEQKVCIGRTAAADEEKERFFVAKSDFEIVQEQQKESIVIFDSTESEGSTKLFASLLAQAFWMRENQKKNKETEEVAGTYRVSGFTMTGYLVRVYATLIHDDYLRQLENGIRPTRKVVLYKLYEFSLQGAFDRGFFMLYLNHINKKAATDGSFDDKMISLLDF